MPNTIDEMPHIDAARGWFCIARSYARGEIKRPHAHAEGQLLFATRGVMMVEAGQKRWVIPPQRALWLPAGAVHTFSMFSQTELRTVYFSPDLSRRCEDFTLRDSVHVVGVNAIFQQLIAALFSAEHNEASQMLMAQLLLQILSEAKALPSELPMPRDERLHLAVQALLRQNNWEASLSQLAAIAAMSERTFSRQFTRDTGFSLRAWKQRARIYASLDLLSNGMPVKQVAYQLGFSCPAAFTAAFRQVMDDRPGDFKSVL